MLEIIFSIISYTPAIVFVATVLDVFFITGYIFYGFAMLSVVSSLLINDAITLQALLAAGIFGTTIGNALNFYIGKKFGSTMYIRKRLENNSVQKVYRQMQSHKLFVVMIVCRFITVLRPAYALLLGTLDVSVKRFLLYEVLISIVWITFWILVIIKTHEVIVKVIS